MGGYTLVDQKVRGLTHFFNGNNLTCKREHITLFNVVFLVDLKSFTLQLFYLRVNIMILKLVKFHIAESPIHFLHWSNVNKSRFCQ